MAEWLYEDGIGEARAALIVDGAIVEARIELPGLRFGTVAEARLTSIVIPRRRGIATIDGREEVLVEPLPPEWTQGQGCRIVIVREAIAEAGAIKRAKARPADDLPLEPGRSLGEAIRIGDVPVRELTHHDADALEAAGWSEAIEAAITGIVAFEGGTLRITPTPAMTLIDIDGWLPPFDLARAAAKACGEAIRRFGIAGSIGIDFPTLASRSERLAVVEAFDAALPLPFERTALNGFGFLQIVRPRHRASLIEQVRTDPAAAAARALLRGAERSGLVGAVQLVAAPAVIDRIEAHPGWTERLSRTLGGAVGLRIDPALAIWGGHAERP